MLPDGWLRLTIKTVCEKCGKEVYYSQDKRVTDRIEHAAPVHNGTRIELLMSEKIVGCEACGHVNQMLHIDVSS